MIIVDATGLICPVPVIETKKAIATLGSGGGIVQVLVDNSVSCDNLSKMSAQKGYQCSVEKKRDRSYAVTITVGEGQSVSNPIPLAAQHAAGEGVVVSISQNKMGAGDDDLGRILIKGFIYSLVNLDVAPKAVLFFNSGVKLTLADANTVDDLNALQMRGTAILVCGACVDFFKCKDQVVVGEITNMYNIVEVLRLANSVINI